MKMTDINQRIDAVIRFLLCVAIFAVPFSKAALETSVVSSCFLWIIKHALIFLEMRSKGKPRSFLRDLGQAFRPARSVLDQGIVLYFLFCILSILGSIRPGQSLDGFLTKTIEGVALYLIVIECFSTRRQIKILVYTLMATAFLTGIDTLIQYYWTHQDFFRGRMLIEGYRATGGFLHPNLLGAFLTIVIPTALGLFFAVENNRRYSREKKILFAIIAIILVWALVLTFSRGAWMGTTAGIIFFMLNALTRKINPRIRGVIIAFTIIAGLLFVIKSSEIKNSVSQTNSVTAEWRIALWREGFYLVKERPFFGHGLNIFMPVMENHLIATQNPLVVGYSASYAHNCYLQMAVEIGVLGLSVFLAMMVMLFRKPLSSLPPRKNDRMLILGMLAGLLAFLVHSAVDINFYSVELPNLFWLVAGLMISLDKQLSDKTSCAIK